MVAAEWSKCGIILGALAYVMQSLTPALGSLMQGLGTSAVRLMVTFDRILEPDRVPKRATPQVRRSPSGARLELHNVTFAYGPHAEPVIAGLDLVVPEGDWAA